MNKYEIAKLYQSIIKDSEPYPIKDNLYGLKVVSENTYTIYSIQDTVMPFHRCYEVHLAVIESTRNDVSVKYKIDPDKIKTHLKEIAFDVYKDDNIMIDIISETEYLIHVSNKQYKFSIKKDFLIVALDWRLVND